MCCEAKPFQVKWWTILGWLHSFFALHCWRIRSGSPLLWVFSCAWPGIRSRLSTHA